MLDNASFCLTRLRPTPSAAFIPVQSIAVDQIRVDPDARLLKLNLLLQYVFPVDVRRVPEFGVERHVRSPLREAGRARSDR